MAWVNQKISRLFPAQKLSMNSKKMKIDGIFTANISYHAHNENPSIWKCDENEQRIINLFVKWMQRDAVVCFSWASSKSMAIEPPI